MRGLPVRYVHQNILVGHGDARAALFRVASISYPFMAGADKREWLRRLARFAFSVEADFSLWRVNRAYPAERYVEQAQGILDARHQDPEAWRSYLAGHEAHLRKLRAFVPEVYLAVSLETERSSHLGAGLLRGADRARRRVEELLGVAAVPPIPASEIEGADGGGGARVCSRSRDAAGAPRDDPRGAVAAASHCLPRRRRAGARRALAAERADGRVAAGAPGV